MAKAGDVVTLSFAADEDITGVTAKIAGSTAAAQATPTGGLREYSATYTVAASSPNGLVAIQIDYEDMAGNAGVQQTVVIGTLGLGRSIGFGRGRR